MLNRTELLRLDAAAKATSADLGRRDPAILNGLRRAATDRTKTELAAAFADASEELRGSVAAIDISPRPGADVRRDVLEALEGRGLSADDLVAAKSRLRGFSPAIELADAVPADAPLEANPALRPELARARLHRLASLAGVAAKSTDAVADKGLTDATIDDVTLGALVESGDITDADARQLGGALGLYRLLDEDPDLTAKVRSAAVPAVAGGKISEPRHLAQLTTDDWRDLLRTTKAVLPEGLSRDQYATMLAKKVATAFPTDALLSRVKPPATADILPTLDSLTSLRARGPVLTAEPQFTAGDAAAVKTAYRQARTLVDRYPGLGLAELLDDPGQSTANKAKEAVARIKSVTTFAQANEGVELLALDYSQDSPDLGALQFGTLSQPERERVLNNVKAYQRLFAVTRDVDDVALLAGAGYHSAASIVADGEEIFVKRTALEPAIAQRYFADALTASSVTTSAAVSIIDAVRGGFGHLNVSNLSPGIVDFFRRIDGWQELFGNQDWCRCEHCSSILGPAAYFVDLMHFIEENLTGKVFVGNLATHDLALRTRRSDLWTLPLTCANTDTEIPLLVIVDEILENYIAKRHGYAGDLSDRAEIWRRVYRDRLASAVDSLSQPFLLPLARLRSYLSHFDRSRATIARLVGQSEAAVAIADLGLSDAEHGLIVTSATTQARLRKLFGLAFAFGAGGVVEPLDAQDLVRAMGVTRDQLGDLLDTRYVSADGAEAIEIRGERRGPDSVQNDIERVRNLRVSSLDRLQRFTRLWRATGWTVRELDLTLAGLREAGVAADINDAALSALVSIRSLAKRFKLTPEKATPLYGTLATTPVTDGRPAFFDRLFNLDDFVRLDGSYPRPGTDFVHPALRDNPAAAPADHAFARLIAGLQVDADRLLQLIVGLATPLGVQPAAATEADRGFELNLANLSLLYRHARLADWLKLPVADLFRLAAIAPGVAAGYVANLAELQAFVPFADGMKESKRSVEDVNYLLSLPVLDRSRYRDPAEVAQRVVERAAADQALTFADTLFAYLPGVSEGDSRRLVAANAAAILPADDGAFRLADDFDPAAALNVPVGLVIDEAAARALLVARHASEVIPTYLASELRVDIAKSRAIVRLSGVNLADPAVATALRGSGAPGPIADAVDIALRLAVLLAAKELDAAAVDLIRANLDPFALADPSAPTVQTIQRIDLYRRAVRRDPERAADLRDVIDAFTPAAGFRAADQAALARVLDIEAAVTASLLSSLPVPATPLEALDLLARAADIAAFIGIDGPTLVDIAGTDYGTLDRAADAMLAAFRAKYPDEDTWAKTIEPFECQILNLRRDGLCDYLVKTLEPAFKTRDDLYRYFLLDVQVDGCFKTSRVVAAISSLQAYVHRVLMNLEQDEQGKVHVLPSLVPLEEWEWRQHYRVWEANRKVFLWPENYLFADLRDDKTPLFRDLESELLQKEIDEQSVLDAYGKYLEGFQEIAKLKIAGSYHEVDEQGKTDVLHLIGVTAGEPPTYYYRRVENARFGEVLDSKGTVWGPWRSVDVKIPVRRVAPVVFNGQLHLFWVEITTSPQNEIADAGSRFVGYTHKLSLKYSTLRLDGRWTPPQRVSMYQTAPFAESDGVVDDPLAEPEEWHDMIAAINGLFGFGVFANPTALASLPEAQRKLITPRYDDEPHSKARDGYTLTGLEWEQVYPEPQGGRLFLAGAGYQLRGTVDLFEKKTQNVPSFVAKRIRFGFNSTPPSPILGFKGSGLYYGTPSSAYFDDYSFAALVADSSRFAWVLRDWSSSLRNSISAGVYAHQIASAGNAKIDPVNGSLSDGVIDVNGDLYLLQGSVRSGTRWLLRRLGTTLAETVARALFTHGVDGLLDLDTQRALGEAPRALGLVGTAIEDRVVHGTIDFTGPYGVYYREIFFQIPFLIAQTLNAQGKFSAAQKWFQYIFNPTSSEQIADDPALSPAANAARKRDRNWRYIEFRNLGVPSLRQILTDPRRSRPTRPTPSTRMPSPASDSAPTRRRSSCAISTTCSTGRTSCSPSFRWKPSTRP
jgi:Neuraminidase-like domain